MRQKVNNKMISLARCSRGLTQAELSEKSGITQGRISKIEHGELGVTRDAIKALSNALDYPPSFFFQEAETYPATLHYYRKKLTRLSKRELTKLEALMNVVRIHIEKLLFSVDLPSSLSMPDLGVDEYGEPELVAKHIRKHWRIPNGPIDNVIELLEKAGIVIIPFDFGTDRLDGMTMLTTKGIPLIFVNKYLPGDRLRFTICHEFGHIAMHILFTPPNAISEIDKEADRFAAEFLMPENDIKTELIKLTIQKLADLKRYWKVAMSALLIKAKTVGTIKERQYKYLWAQLSKLGYTRREPPLFDLEIEKPTLFKELIDIHLEDLEYSFNELAKILSIFPSELGEIYMGEEPPANELRIKPRIVR